MSLSPDALKRCPCRRRADPHSARRAVACLLGQLPGPAALSSEPRNFRLIAVLAGQTENLIENRVRMVRDALGNAKPNAKTDVAMWVA